MSPFCYSLLHTSSLLINLNFTSSYSYFALYVTVGNYYYFYSHFIYGFCCAPPVLSWQLLFFSNLYVFHLYQLFKSHTSQWAYETVPTRHLLNYCLSCTLLTRLLLRQCINSGGNGGGGSAAAGRQQQHGDDGGGVATAVAARQQWRQRGSRVTAAGSGSRTTEIVQRRW